MTTARIATGGVRAHFPLQAKPEYKFTSGIRKTTYALNTLSEPVYIKDRFGLYTALEPKHDPYSNQLTIRTELQIDSDNYAIVKQQLYRDIDPMLFPVLHILKTLFIEQEKVYGQTQSMLLTVDLIYDREEMLTNEIQYSGTHDLMFTMDPRLIEYPHPWSDVSLLEDRCRSMGDIHGQSVIIELIDHNQQIPKQYCNLFGKIVEIVPKNVPDRPEGLYITFWSNDNEPQGFIREELAERKKYHIYSTQDEAINYGNVVAGQEQQRLKERHELEASLAQMKAEFSQRELQLRKELNETKAEYLRQEFILKQQQSEQQNLFTTQQIEMKQMLLKKEEEITKLKHDLETEKLKRADTYESRSYQRKESIELLKFIPAVIAAGLAIWVGILKFKP